MSLPLQPPFAPMDALLVDEIPEGDVWQYEPKWDGFRCLVFRDGKKTQLQSKSGESLTRYFPELVEAFLKLETDQVSKVGAGSMRLLESKELAE